MDEQRAATAIRVVDNAREHRYEATVDGVLAVAEYRRQPGTITFTHTEVPREIGGRGVADALARSALDAARAEGVKVVPRCPFFDAFMRRHHDLRAPPRERVPGAEG
jgi:predicted GNAT family acetyltransferase